MGYSTRASRGSRDETHGAIASALKLVGCSVIDLGSVGRGVPDLLVGRNGRTYLLEVKNVASRPHRAKDPAAARYAEYLTDDQVDFLASWRGTVVHLVTCPEEALAVVCPCDGDVQVGLAGLNASSLAQETTP